MLQLDPQIDWKDADHWNKTICSPVRPTFRRVLNGIGSKVGCARGKGSGGCSGWLNTQPSHPPLFAPHPAAFSVLPPPTTGVDGFVLVDRARSSHVAHMEEDRTAYKILIGKPNGKKRPLVRPSLGWKIILEWILTKWRTRVCEWRDLGQGQEHWRDLDLTRHSTSLQKINENKAGKDRKEEVLLDHHCRSSSFVSGKKVTLGWVKDNDAVIASSRLSNGRSNHNLPKWFYTKSNPFSLM
ncbi:hypothetical protein M0802_000051 [Mischocyttarus mexicanus]|nr:hypothetical protein M0802_000051 [Mischocyttarus mexicanus]